MRELFKRIGRAATFFWAGTSLWAGALEPTRIVPAQASPGEGVVVRLGGTGAGVRDCRTPVSIAVGSVRVSEPRCWTADGVWYGFTLPAGPAAPMPGPQRLEVLRAGERLNLTLVRTAPNFEVLPAGEGVVAVASPEVLRALGRGGELDLGLLGQRAGLAGALPDVPRELFDQYLAPDLTRLREVRLNLPALPERLPRVVPRVPSPLPGVPFPYPPGRTLPRELPRAPVLPLPGVALREDLRYGLTFPVAPPLLGRPPARVIGAGRPLARVIPGTATGEAFQVCDPDTRLFGRADFPGPLGLTIELARRTYGETGGLVIAPSTSGHPPHTTQNGAGPYATAQAREAAQATAMRAIGTMTGVGEQMERTPGLGRGEGVDLFVIDTLAARSPAQDTEPGLDASPTRVETLWGQQYLTQGHGVAAWALLKDPGFGVAPGVTLHPVPTCGPDGRCLMDAVVRGLCAAASHHQTTGRPVIVNLSMATPQNHPLLRKVLSEVTGAGVAVVVAYGNDDRCRVPGRGAQDRCNAYPADWTASLGARPPLTALYSVGAKENDWKAVQPFQRGVSSGLSVPTQPGVYAPGFFWLGVGDLAPWSVSAPLSQARWNAALARSDLRPFKGTSFAAPLAAGALALWAEMHPSEPWPSLSGNLCLLGPADPAACPTPLLP